MNRVVITGLGIVSAVGKDVDSYWNSLLRANAKPRPSVLIPSDRATTRPVFEIHDFDPTVYFHGDEIKRLDRVSQLALVAAQQAVEQSGFTHPNSPFPAFETSVVVGTAIGGQHTMDDSLHLLYAKGANRLRPMTIPKLMMSAAASQISMRFGIKGPTYTVTSACASATHAIGQAFELIRSGKTVAAITGGAESCITAGSLKGWEAMTVLADDCCRPFSVGRKGIVLGEGSAILVLENLVSAKDRGANILGEIVGFGMGADSNDLTAPDPRGMVSAIEAALRDAGASSDSVDYVNAHGTGTVSNDVAETKALHTVLGARANKTPVSSTKSTTGHALGATGAFEAVAIVQSMLTGVIPPTANFLAADPDCNLDCVPNTPRQQDVRLALSNSFAFGGLNAVLALRRFDS